MDRRHFNQICSGMFASAVLSSKHASATQAKAYLRTVLHADSQTQLKVTGIEPGVAYVFFYPFITTPSFLIDLDKESPVGVGPKKSIVAYSAICSHKMSHPAKEISFINYRHDEVEFYGRSNKTEKRTGVISCCSERSVYDAADGASVLGGPAPHPLARIELEYREADDSLAATASSGAEMYDRFFEKFGFRASLEHKVSDPEALSRGTAIVKLLENYSGQIIRC